MHLYLIFLLVVVFLGRHTVENPEKMKDHRKDIDRF